MRISTAAQEMKDDLSFKDVTQRYGMEYRGGFTCCPFHNEKTGSFSAKGKLGKCFGCGWRGDIFDFTGQFFGLSYIESVKKIASDFGYHYDFESREETAADRKALERFLIRQQEKERIERLTEYLETLCDIYRLYDYWRTEYAPATPQGALLPQYLEAIKNIDRVSAMIDTVEDKLYELKEKQHE